jgi:hypothetical protein
MAKWVEFNIVGASPSGKTLRVMVSAKEGGEELGIIQWRSGWRCYVFEPTNAVFEQDCLRDIADKLERMTAEHKQTYERRRSNELWI